MNDANKKNAMKVEVTVWSATGHTPITGRGSYYRDELVKEETNFTSPDDALEYVKGLINRTPHAAYAHYYIPEYWNQNRRQRFIHKSECI